MVYQFTDLYTDADICEMTKNWLHFVYNKQQWQIQIIIYKKKYGLGIPCCTLYILNTIT